MYTIVLVDDEQNWLEIMTTMLNTTLSFETQLFTFSNPDKAIDYIKNSPIDCVIADYLIPGYMTGLDM